MRADMTIYFIRHGETDWNARVALPGPGRRSHERDRPRRRRDATARRCVRCSPPSPTANYRRQSAAARPRDDGDRARRPGPRAVRLPLDERLKEVHYGQWQGTLRRDLPAIDPPGIEARARDTFRWRPQGGESYEDLTVRAVDWLKDSSGDTVVSAHGGVSRVLRGHLLRARRGDRAGAAGATGSRSRPAPRWHDMVVVTLRRTKEEPKQRLLRLFPVTSDRPLGDGCSSRQGAALIFGHGQGPARDAYGACDTRPADLTPLSSENVAKPVVPRRSLMMTGGPPPSGGNAQRSRIARSNASSIVLSPSSLSRIATQYCRPDKLGRASLSLPLPSRTLASVRLHS